MTELPELKYARAVLGREYAETYSLRCSRGFAEALGLRLDFASKSLIDFDPGRDATLGIYWLERPVRVTYVRECRQPHFWDCVVVLVALAHPDPPEELAACAALVLSRGTVQVVREEGSP